MINWKESAELNNCTIKELKFRLKRFPSSAKKVVVVCDECGKIRNLSYSDYCDLCHSCSVKTPEQHEKRSEGHKGIGLLDLPEEEICIDYLNGMSTIKLSKKYNCSQQTISRRLIKNNIKLRSLSEVQIELDLPDKNICIEYLDGISMAELAIKYKCCEWVIRNRLSKTDIKIRSPGEFQILDLPDRDICVEYLDGVNMPELAMKYKCSTNTIKRRLIENGIAIRLSNESRKGIKISEIGCQHISAGKQGIPYDEWEDFARDKLYCPKFNEVCRESNRAKYERLCFLSDLPEENNITSTGKQKKLSVHHTDMDKGQGCDGARWRLVPLCMEYHAKAHSEPWKSRIIWLLENVWDNEEY